MSMLVSHSDPTMRIFTELADKNKKDITIKDFQAMMEQMDRWDVIDDTEALFRMYNIILNGTKIYSLISFDKQIYK